MIPIRRIHIDVYSCQRIASIVVAAAAIIRRKVSHANITPLVVIISATMNIVRMANIVAMITIVIPILHVIIIVTSVCRRSS